MSSTRLSFYAITKQEMAYIVHRKTAVGSFEMVSFAFRWCPKICSQRA